MKFKLEIQCDNSAFDPCASDEVSTILFALAETMSLAPGNYWNLSDSNGNAVGEAEFTGKKGRK